MCHSLSSRFRLTRQPNGGQDKVEGMALTTSAAKVLSSYTGYARRLWKQITKQNFAWFVNFYSGLLSALPEQRLKSYHVSGLIYWCSC